MIRKARHISLRVSLSEHSGCFSQNTLELYHDYNRESRWVYLNYGGGLVISPFKWLSVYGVYTTHAVYGGISLNFGGMSSFWSE